MTTGRVTTSAASLVPVNITLGVVLAGLLVLAAGVVGWFGLSPDTRTRRRREVLTAGLRAAVQLTVVSLVLERAVRSLWGLAVFLVLMFAVAVHTAGRRITDNRTGYLTAVPIAAGVVPVLAALLLCGLLPLSGIALIPVAGILIGGAMTATVLAGRRVLDELRARHGETEAALALGFAERDARSEIARPVASDALLPGLDQTRTVGLVTLPGAFVGMLLAGASPLPAGAVQLFVLIALMAVQTVAVAVTVELVSRRLVYRSPVAGQVAPLQGRSGRRAALRGLRPGGPE